MLLRLLLTGSLKTWQAECSQQHGLEHKNLVQNLKSSPLSKCVHSTACRAVPTMLTACSSTAYLTKLPEATTAGIHRAHPAISLSFFKKKTHICTALNVFLHQMETPNPPRGSSCACCILARPAPHRVDGQERQLVVRAAVLGSNLLSLQVPAEEEKNQRKS